MKKFVAWVKKNRGWLWLTGGLSLVVLAQHVVVKGEHQWNEELLNKLIDATKDPDKYADERVNDKMQELTTFLADILEFETEADGISREAVDHIADELRKDWRNFIDI